MKKKTKILLIVGVILVVCSYFGYKAFNLLVRYNIDNKSDVIDSLKINDSKFVQFQQNLKDNQEYLEFKDIKIRNDFKKFTYLEDVSTKDDLKYVLYDDNKNRKAAFMIGVGPTYIEILIKDKTIFANDNHIKEKDINNIELFLKEKNITNDIELFQYIIKHKNSKFNLFTSTKTLKENYILYYLMNIILPNSKSITLIEGAYSGYIFNLDNGIKEANILYDDKRYVFTFIEDKYFKDEYIYELLNTILFENNINEFTKTYQVIEKVENNSLDYLSFKIKKFQDENIEIVDIKKELAQNIEIGKTYEFTFKKNNSNNIDDNIKSIFNNTELINIKQTNKIGLEQIQESIK